MPRTWDRTSVAVFAHRNDTPRPVGLRAGSSRGLVTVGFGVLARVN